MCPVQPPFSCYFNMEANLILTFFTCGAPGQIQQAVFSSKITHKCTVKFISPAFSEMLEELGKTPCKVYMEFEQFVLNAHSNIYE